jgi:GTP-binding protein Era
MTAEKPSSSIRCGVVAVLGAPNAGKSTLVNALVGQKIAITSPKAQTTRTRVLGVALEGDTQIVLVDTPGIFAPKRRLDRAMVQAAWGGVQDADLIALVVDSKAGLGEKVEAMLTALEARKEPKILILNKVDIADKGKLLIHAQRLNERIPFRETYFISAATGDGLAEMKSALAAAMPEGPWHFPADQVSNASDRMLSAEITREQIYHQLHAELPYENCGGDGEIQRTCGRLGRDPPADIGGKVLPARHRARQERPAPQGNRIPLPRGAIEPARLPGAPLPPRQGQGKLGRRPRGLSGYRAGLGGINVCYGTSLT